MTTGWNPLDGFAVERSYVFDSVKLFGSELKSIAIGLDRLDKAAAKRDHKPALRLGLAALSYFDAGFNGPRGELWLKPRQMPALKPALNLSGVLMLPHYQGIASRLKVDEDTKAWELGLRDGDELLKIDGEPPDDSRGNGRQGLPDRVLDGRPLRVTVRRGGVEVTLRR
jgi:S1-C subfamily serine protease